MEPRNYESGAVGTAPTAPASPSNGYATDGNPGTGTPATRPGAHWYHKMGEELRAVIVAAGLTPSDANIHQLLDAIQALFAPLGSLNTRAGHTYSGSDWYWVDKANGEFCQFTMATVTSGSTISFPVPFPTACDRVIAVHGSGATGALSFATGTFDRFGAVVFHNAGISANMTVIAWGH